MGFGAVFSMACHPVLIVLITCGVGAIIAQPHVNAFDKNARKSLNKLVFLVFTPALVFTKLANALTLENLIKWWYIPFNVILCFAIGASLGYAVVILSKPPQHLSRLTIASCAAGNAGNLPLVLIPALCSDKRSPFGAANVCSDHAISYISFGMCVAIILTWTIVYNMLKPDESLNTEVQATFGTLELQEGKYETIVTGASTSVSVADSPFTNSTELKLEALDIGINQPVLTNQWQVTSPQTYSLPPDVSSSMMSLSSLSLASINNLPPLPHEKLLKRIFTPPTTAALLGFIVGAIPPLKDLFLVGPFSIFISCANLLGEAMIPSMNLVLGGNLTEGASGSDLQPLTIAGICTVRLVVLPIIGLFVVQMAASLGFLLPEDKMFHFVLLLQFSVPSAINIGTIAQLHGYGEKESSIVLFWGYILSVITLTIWISVYLWLLF